MTAAIPLNKLRNDFIKDSILKNINKQNTVFVFPTQICANMWADRILETGEIKAVALDRFIAWDAFKSSSIKSQHQDKKSIPSTLRKIFAENIIKKNSEEPFFKNIISTEYASSAARFASWIASVLPSLALWKNAFEKKHIEADDEDEDFLELYNRYKTFLDENNLFDPAWETPPFESDGNKYIIYAPEILMDYCEYKPILESSEDIELVHIPQSDELPEGHFFANSRIELKEVAHYLLTLKEKQNVSWDRVAVSVPDLDSYGPYIEREFDLYGIPHVLRNGKPLSLTGPGKLFSQLLECKAENFSFNSLKNLLLNNELPWATPKLNDDLILFGRQNNCLCSYEFNGNNVDVWEESFKHPIEVFDVRLSDYYRELKKTIINIVDAKNFSDIRLNYFYLKDKFFNFNITDYPEENDKILSRCISELGALIDLEQNFQETNVFEIPSCFSFFNSYLSEKMYVLQNPELGVQILPYRTAACAPFDVHIVVDASQSALAVVYKQLGFLREDKRKQFGMNVETNITEGYVKLYALMANTAVLYTCSQKTFDGYSFTNSNLSKVNHIPSKDCKKPESFIKDDFYQKEKSFFLDDKDVSFKKIFKPGSDGFNRWSSISADTKIEIPENNELKKCIENTQCEDGRVKVSVTKLKKFFTCPRSFLYDYILNVSPTDNVAKLINQYEMGNLNHLILEKYCKALKSNNLSIKFDMERNNIPASYDEILQKAIDDAIEERRISHLAKQLVLTIRGAVEKNIALTVRNFSIDFNEYTVFEMEKEYIYEPKDKDYKIKSKVDCILLSPEAELVLIDFKNTAYSIPDNIYWTNDAAGTADFQLPLYKYIIENQKKPEKISACMFYSIKESFGRTIYSEVEKFSGPNQEENNILFNQTQKKCLENVDAFVENLRNCNFSPEQLKVDSSQCYACQYKSVCRRTFTIGKHND